MIEDIVLSADLNQTAVGIARAHPCMFHIRDSRQANIAAADQDPSVFKAVIGIVADRVAEVVAVEGAVNKIVLPVELTHGAGFSERLRLIRRSPGLIPGQHSAVGVQM